MFDIGFSELLLIAIVALIVIGPQQLPRVARTLGHLFGRMQRYVNDVKADITREMELHELKKLQASMEDTARSMHDSVNQTVSDTEGELGRIAQSAQAAADPYAEAGPPASAAPNPSPEVAPPVPPAAGSAQGELPLEPGQQPPAPRLA
jgi:sec-independent protein translocase protein TatB